MFKVYQLQLNEKHVKAVNEGGWNVNPITTVYANNTNMPKVETVEADYVLAAASGLLVHTMNVHSDDVDEVYDAGNGMAQVEVEHIIKHKSISLGDLIVDENNVGHIVDYCGYIAVAPKLVEKIVKIVEFTSS